MSYLRRTNRCKTTQCCCDRSAGIISFEQVEGTIPIQYRNLNNKPVGLKQRVCVRVGDAAKLLNTTTLYALCYFGTTKIEFPNRTFEQVSRTSTRRDKVSVEHIYIYIYLRFSCVVSFLPQPTFTRASTMRIRNVYFHTLGSVVVRRSRFPLLAMTVHTGRRWQIKREKL